MVEGPWAALWISPWKPNQVTKGHIDCGGWRGALNIWSMTSRKAKWLFEIAWPNWITVTWVIKVLQCGTTQVLRSFVTTSKVIQLSCFSIAICSGSQHSPSPVTRLIHTVQVFTTVLHTELYATSKPDVPTVPTVAGKKEKLLLGKAHRCSWLASIISPTCLPSQF